MSLNGFRRFGAAIATAGLAIGLLGGSVSAGNSVTRWVDDDGHAGPANGCVGSAVAFEVIQDAIDASGPGDKVKVCPGTYHENVTVDVQGLTLVGSQSSRPKVKPVTAGSSTAGFDDGVVEVTADDVTVSWLNIEVPATGDCNYRRTGILVSNAEDVRIRANRLTGGNGDPTACGLTSGVIFNNSTGQVAYNIVRNFVYQGIDIANGSDVSVYRNSIRLFVNECSTAACTSGSTPAGYFGYQRGIGVYSATARIRRNVIRADAETAGTTLSTSGIEVWYVSGTGPSAHVRHNRIVGADYGIILYQSTALIDSNVVRDGGLDGILLSDGDNSEIMGNRVTNQGYRGMVADASSMGNNIHDNNFAGNDSTDCVDQTGDAVPAAVDLIDNTWTNDTGNESLPTGLCTPESN